MQSKILITNNTDGNHSADAYAMAAAETLADIADLNGAKALEGQKLLVRFADVLTKYFVNVQDIEQSRLADDPKYIHTDVWHEVNIDVDRVTKEIIKAAMGTPWEDHYQQAAVKDVVRGELKQLFCTSMHVDRMIHANRNPSCEHARAYKAQYGVQ